MIKNLRLTRALSAAVMLTSFAVMAGWVLDIEILKSILPHWVTMKFITAFCFFLSGISLWVTSMAFEGRSLASQLVLPITTLLILFLMATLFLSTLFGIRTGIEDVFVREAEGAVKTVTPGRPSVGTMAGFLLVGTINLFVLFHFEKPVFRVFHLGGVISVLGIIACLGYLFKVPALYFALQGWSTAMALHTGILFVLLGLAAFFLGVRDPGTRHVA